MIDFSTFKNLTIGSVALQQLFINGVQVWKANNSQSGYKNWVKYSTETDKVTIYNGGLGYMEGYRLSSSGGMSSQANTVTTGFIPCKSTDVIRLAGVDYSGPTGGYCYLMFYDESLNVLGSTSNGKNSNYATGVQTQYRGIVVTNDKHTVNSAINNPSTENGVTTFDNYKFSDDSGVAYFRINGYGNGSDMIVTVNEEITL